MNRKYALLNPRLPDDKRRMIYEVYSKLISGMNLNQLVK
jgi:hypothetical protein